MDYLSLYLDVADSMSLPDGWSRNASFSLAVVNHKSVKYTVKKGTSSSGSFFCLVWLSRYYLEIVFLSMFI